MLIPFLSLMAVIVVLVTWFVVIYNRLVELRNMKDEGWSGIDVQLKRRSNLIPNLIETVKGYMVHERSVLENITKLRSQTMNAGSVGSKMSAESSLSRILGNLFAVAENYPDLKANQNFIDLQNQLSEIEDEIQMARRYYNGTVRNLNVGIETFPNSVVAGIFSFTTADFYETVHESERTVPKIDFSASRP